MHNYAKAGEGGKFEFPVPVKRVVVDGKTTMVMKTAEEIEAEGFKKVFAHTTPRPKDAGMPKFEYIDKGDYILATVTWAAKEA